MNNTSKLTYCCYYIKFTSLFSPDYLVEKENCRAVKIHDARENKELYECGCCFDDECLFEEMSSCADGHLFCNSCVKGSAESAIGEGKTNFPCLTGDCEYCFPLTVLQSILSPNKFSIALRKMQEEELRQANIPDLVSCPFCSFATIMSNPDDNLFKCLNPDCLKESCRYLSLKYLCTVLYYYDICKRFPVMKYSITIFFKSKNDCSCLHLTYQRHPPTLLQGNNQLHDLKDFYIR